MTALWRQILARHVEEKGQAQAARELGYSASALCQVFSGKYQGSHEKIAARVMAVYGRDGKVNCPVLGRIEPLKCLKIWERAKVVGLKCGNPRTARLHKTCKTCQVRR